MFRSTPLMTMAILIQNCMARFLASTHHFEREGVPAAVRHFYRKEDVIWVGINSSNKTLVLKYEKEDGKNWVRKGEADVGMDVFCVAPKNI